MQLSTYVRALLVALAVFLPRRRETVIPRTARIFVSLLRGGGTTASGQPCWCARESRAGVSAYASYFIDNVSCASIGRPDHGEPVQGKARKSTVVASTTCTGTRTIGLSVLRSKESTMYPIHSVATVTHEGIGRPYDVQSGITTWVVTMSARLHHDFADHVNTLSIQTRGV